MTEPAATPHGGTAPVAPNPISALDLVVDDAGDATAAIERALDDSGALDESEDPVHVRAAKHMRKQIAEHIAGILVQLPVTDMLVGAWKHLNKVDEARIETRKEGTTRTIAVGNHELTVRHDPQIDLVVDHIPVPLLKLFFDAVFTIDNSVFEITAGEITHTTPGPISAKAVLSSNKVIILERGTPKVDPRGLWPNEFEGPYVIVDDKPAEAAKPEPTKSQLSF